MRTQKGTPAGTTNWFGSSRTPPPVAFCFVHLRQQHTTIKTETMAKTIVGMKKYRAVMLANLLTCLIINYFSCCFFLPFFLFSLLFSFSCPTLFTFPLFSRSFPLFGLLTVFFSFFFSAFFFFFTFSEFIHRVSILKRNNRITNNAEGIIFKTFQPKDPLLLSLCSIGSFPPNIFPIVNTNPI